MDRYVKHEILKVNSFTILCTPFNLPTYALHMKSLYHFTFSPQVVRESPRIRIVRQKDVHAYRSIIIIKGAKKEDEGLYEITVKNREGEAKNHITLRVTVSPHPFCYLLQLKSKETQRDTI